MKLKKKLDEPFLNHSFAKYRYYDVLPVSFNCRPLFTVIDHFTWQLRE